MELTWHGHARFRLRAGGLSWWFDTGADPAHYESDPATILLDASASTSVGRDWQGGTPVLDGPGEYELRGVPVIAVRTSAPGAARTARPVAFRLVVDGVRVGYLGATTRDDSATADGVGARAIAELAPVDVAVVPIGDGVGYGAAAALALARTLEAKVVVAYLPDPDSVAAQEAVRRLSRDMGSELDAPVRALTLTGNSVPAVPRVSVLANRSADAVA